MEKTQNTLDTNFTNYSMLPAISLSQMVRLLGKQLEVQDKHRASGKDNYCSPSIFFLGPPGAGKTSVITAFARAHGMEVDTQVLSRLTRTDLAGIPYTVEPNTVRSGESELGDGEQEGFKARRVTQMAPAAWLAQLTREFNPNGKATILYFNEYNSCPDHVKPAAYQILQERMIGQLHLRDNVMLLSDGNPEQMVGRAVAKSLLPTEATRYLQFYVNPSLTEWQEYSMHQGYDPLVSYFLETDAGLFQAEKFEPGLQDGFPCPRTWDRLNQLLPVYLGDYEQTGNITKEQYADLSAIVHGTVGRKAGQSFLAYIKYRNEIPAIDTILNDPQEFLKIDKKGNVAHYCASAVAREVGRRVVQEGDYSPVNKFAKLLTVIGEAKGNKKEYGALMWNVLRKYPGIVTPLPSDAALPQAERSKRVGLITLTKSDHYTPLMPIAQKFFMTGDQGVFSGDLMKDYGTKPTGECKGTSLSDLAGNGDLFTGTDTGKGGKKK